MVTVFSYAGLAMLVLAGMAEMNDDVAMRSELQDHLPNPSRLVVLDGADVPIDSLRKGSKKNNDSNKFYNNDLDPNIRRQLSFPILLPTTTPQQSNS